MKNTKNKSTDIIDFVTFAGLGGFFVTIISYVLIKFDTSVASFILHPPYTPLEIAQLSSFIYYLFLIIQAVFISYLLVMIFSLLKISSNHKAFFIATPAGLAVYPVLYQPTVYPLGESEENSALIFVVLALVAVVFGIVFWLTHLVRNQKSLALLALGVMIVAPVMSVIALAH